MHSQVTALALVVGRLGDAIHQINPIQWMSFKLNKPRYPLDSDISLWTHMYIFHYHYLRRNIFDSPVCLSW